MKVFSKLSIGMFLVFGGMFSASAIAQTNPSDTFGFHGMVLFGEKNTYVSHLPMFHAPHNYQAVFKVIVDESTEGGAAYKEMKSAGETGLFSIAPSELFELKKMIDGEINEFTADVYQGHFEKQGAVKLGPAKIKVLKTVFSKDINGLAVGGPRWIEQKYIVFGSLADAELYGLHEVTTKPSYDAIFKLELKIGVPPKHSKLPVLPDLPTCKTRVCPKPVFPKIPTTDFIQTVTFKAISDLEVPKVIKGTVATQYDILETVHLDFADLNPHHAMGM